MVVLPLFLLRRGMKIRSFFTLSFIVIIAILIAGCTNQPANDVVSTSPVTTPPTSIPATTVTTLFPQPTTPPTSNPTTPAISNSIAFTSVPSIGSYSLLTGTAKVTDPSKFKVVVYIFVSGWWGPKPQWENPYSVIKPDGTWSTNIVTGGSDTQATKITAFLVPSGYKPPNMNGDQQLPGDLNQFVSVTAER
jgi:hypothetical protein